MGVNHDLARRAVVATDEAEWVARGPLQEKVLEDDDATRRTAIVRMPPGVRLPELESGLYDVVVLDGQMHDGTRAYPHGWYVQTAGPVTSVIGCTLFVRLRPSDRYTRHAVDLRSVALEAGKSGAGVDSAMLHEDKDGAVALFRIVPCGRIRRHRHERGEEIFVLDGDVSDELGRYKAKTWVRQPPDSVHSVTSEEGGTFLVFAEHMEVAHIEAPPPVGRLLDEILREGARPWDEALALVARICAAVPAARAAGHIDYLVEPGGIYIDDATGTVTLVEPVAEVMPRKYARLRPLDHLSPELLMGKPRTPAATTYALGVIAYQLLTGRVPFPDAKGPAGLITAMLKTVPPPPSATVAVPPAVDALVMACLERDRNRRCADPEQLQAAIDAILAR